MVKLKRVYEKAAKADGYRVLVDRLWPRGLSKPKAKIDFWAKEVAPSNSLRKWFGHKPEKWPEFKNKYRLELKSNQAAVKELKTIIKKQKTVTLLYGAKDQQHNNAVVLKIFLW